MEGPAVLLAWPLRSVKHALLQRPLPFPVLLGINAVLVGIIDRVDDLPLQPIHCMRSPLLEVRHAVDYVDGEVEAVYLVQDRQLQRRIDVALLLVATHMEVVVIRAPISQLVDQRRIGVEVEDDRLVSW